MLSAFWRLSPGTWYIQNHWHRQSCSPCSSWRREPSLDCSGWMRVFYCEHIFSFIHIILFHTSQHSTSQWFSSPWTPEPSQCSQEQFVSHLREEPQLSEWQPGHHKIPPWGTKIIKKSIADSENTYTEITTSCSNAFKTFSMWAHRNCVVFLTLNRRYCYVDGTEQSTDHHLH